MGDFDRWDVALLVAAGYIAVMGLVRLMTARRDRLVAEVRQQVAAEKKRQRRLRERAAQKDSKVA